GGLTRHGAPIEHPLRSAAYQAHEQLAVENRPVEPEIDCHDGNRPHRSGRIARGHERRRRRVLEYGRELVPRHGNDERPHVPAIVAGAQRETGSVDVHAGGTTRAYLSPTSLDVCARGLRIELREG